VTAATSERVQRDGGGDAVGCTQMESNGADRQQGQTDRRGDSDRRPHQTDEHPRDAGEFAHADEAPLQPARNREPELIRCVRLWTGSDDASHVQSGRLDMVRGRNADSVSAEMSASHMTVEETASGGSLAWRTAPVPPARRHAGGHADLLDPRR
jgi:hypothetical protein